jgi:hypothetical protein
VSITGELVRNMRRKLGHAWSVAMGGNDIETARRRRRRMVRGVWLNEFSFYVEVTWPKGVAGCLFGILTMLLPAGLLVVGIWLQRLSRRRYLKAILSIETIAVAIAALLFLVLRCVS